MVQTVGLALAVYLLPIAVLHSRVTGQREDTAFERTPEEYRVPVHFETCAVGFELAESEGAALFFFITIGFNGCTQVIQVRAVFRPEQGVVAQR